jgi:hypothetical protein
VKLWEKNAINLITISTGKQAIKENKIIWILVRQHPVETTSSFIVEGSTIHLLQLMIKAVEAQNSLYDNSIFKIIPMNEFKISDYQGVSS